MKAMAPFALLAVAACATTAPVAAPPAPQPADIPPPVVSGPPPAPEGDRWLYGSGESSATSLQVYRQLTDYALAKAKARPAQSVVLKPGSNPTASTPLAFEPCGNKPLAFVFDADETLIWNIPPTRDFAEMGKDYDGDTWKRWERTGAGHATAMPGSVEALAALRKAGITPIANTNRLAENAAGTAATLEAAGLGQFVHGKTLFLKNDDATGSSKDARRTLIASRYCVIGMSGDQLGDFSQAFNVKGLGIAARKAAAFTGPASSLWGRGWFLQVNPTYGPALDGDNDFDAIYGKDDWQ